MTKPLTVEKRLSAIEDQVAHLNGGALIGGIIAKAHSATPYDPLVDDGDATGPSPDMRRMNIFENRLNRLEGRFDDLYNHVIGKPPAQDDDQEALGVLAKAQNASLRKNSAAGILDRAQRVLDDPTAVGVIEGYVQGGQLRKAAEMLERHEQRDTHADENKAQERVESQVKTYEEMATVSELSEKMSAFETTLNALLERLGRLERPASAPAQEQTVAKGHGKKRRRQESDHRDTPAGLAERAQGVIDSPAMIGQVASMLQSGDESQIAQARRTIEAAELRHESRMKTRDRRQL